MVVNMFIRDKGHFLFFFYLYNKKKIKPNLFSIIYAPFPFPIKKGEQSF